MTRIGLGLGGVWEWRGFLLPSNRTCTALSLMDVILIFDSRNSFITFRVFSLSSESRLFSIPYTIMLFSLLSLSFFMRAGPVGDCLLKFLVVWSRLEYPVCLAVLLGIGLSPVVLSLGAFLMLLNGTNSFRALFPQHQIVYLFSEVLNLFFNGGFEG